MGFSLLKNQVKNCSLGYMEQAPSRGHEASPQSGLGVGCKLCSSSKNLRGLYVSAQARRMGISFSFSIVEVSLFLSLQSKNEQAVPWPGSKHVKKHPDL